MNDDTRETFATVAEVKTEVDRILADPLDTERSHMDEDLVCESFVRSIARGTAQDPVGMAREIERMLAADLNRWYS
jgi:hypothetical protein